MEFLFVFSDAPICQSQLVDQLIGVTAEESISINCRVSKYTKKDKIELDLKKGLNGLNVCVVLKN